MHSQITIVVAVDAANGIGINNQLPWHLPEDLAHFKRTTMGHPIIMGRKTFDSIGRPLPNRRNIVITRNHQWQHDGVEVAHSLQEALELVADVPACVIGGAQIFTEALPAAQYLVVTHIDKTFACDTFFPPIDGALWEVTQSEEHVSEANGFNYRYVYYARRP